MLWLDANGIDYANVGSAFPNLNTGEHLLLNGDLRHFSEKNFSQNHYIMVSNVFNDFSEDEFKALKKEWNLLKSWREGTVWIEFYRK